MADDIATKTKAEHDSHDKSKQAISDRQSAAFKTLLAIEGLTEALIGAILAFIYKILALILVPDFTFSKVLAAILGIGLGIYLAYRVIDIIFTSLDDFRKILKDTADAEKREEDRHTAAINRLLG